MRTFAAIFFWILAGLGVGWFTYARRLHAWLQNEHPDKSEGELLERAFKARPGDFDDPEAAHLAKWMRRLGIGFLIGFLLWISMGFVVVALE